MPHPHKSQEIASPIFSYLESSSMSESTQKSAKGTGFIKGTINKTIPQNLALSLGWVSQVVAQLLIS